MKTNLSFTHKDFYFDDYTNRTTCRLFSHLKIPNYIVNSFIELPGWKNVVKKYGLHSENFFHVRSADYCTIEIFTIGYATKHKNDNLSKEIGEKVAYVKAQRTAFWVVKCLMQEIKKHLEKHIIKSLDNSIMADMSALYTSAKHLENLSK